MFLRYDRKNFEILEFFWLLYRIKKIGYFSNKRNFYLSIFSQIMMRKSRISFFTLVTKLEYLFADFLEFVNSWISRLCKFAFLPPTLTTPDTQNSGHCWQEAPLCKTKRQNSGHCRQVVVHPRWSLTQV